MKAGTSWWAHLLAAHPNATRVQPKELHYFDHFTANDFTDADREYYWRFFARPRGMIAGEWTPRYMWDFWTPELLRRAAPDARLVVILRDPIERYISGITHDHARRSFPLSAVLAQTHFDRGRYDEQLDRVLQRFPRSQLLVLQYERCVRDWRDELRRTYQFVGLAPDDFVPPDAQDLNNPTTSAKHVLSTHIRETLREGYAPTIARLLELAPEIDLDLWPNFRSAVAQRRDRGTG